MRWLDGITDSVDMSLGPGVEDGQGGLVCCSSWGHKELDTTEQLNWTELNKAGDLSSIPGSGRSPGEGNGNSPQYSCLENSMDTGG